jgi:hypothetical protein
MSHQIFDRSGEVMAIFVTQPAAVLK